MSLGSCDSTGLGEGSAGVRRRRSLPGALGAQGSPYQEMGEEEACGNGKEEWAAERGEYYLQEIEL